MATAIMAKAIMARNTMIESPGPWPNPVDLKTPDFCTFSLSPSPEILHPIFCFFDA